MDNKIKEFILFIISSMFDLMIPILHLYGLQLFLLVLLFLLFNLLLFYFLYALLRLFFFILSIFSIFICIYFETNWALFKKLYGFFCEPGAWIPFITLLIIFYLSLFPLFTPRVYEVVFFPVISNFFFVLYRLVIFYAQSIKESSNSHVLVYIASAVVKLEGSPCSVTVKYVCFICWIINVIVFSWFLIICSSWNWCILVFAVWCVFVAFRVVIDLEFFYDPQKKKRKGALKR